MLTERFERLNALAQITSAATYLEIGVEKGETFKQVDIPYKVGVDPNFRFDVDALANERTIFHRVTSDVFFSTLARAHGTFDLIYLDGLHTFEQTFRDFCASLGFAHPKTIWLIDDTHPSDRLAANPDRRVTKVMRRLLRIRDGRWMGDVFKVVFAIHDYFPQFSYATFPDHGQTAVWPEARKDFAPAWASLGKIGRMGYGDFLRSRDSYLQITDSPKILDAVARVYSADR